MASNKSTGTLKKVIKDPKKTQKKDENQRTLLEINKSVKFDDKTEIKELKRKVKKVEDDLIEEKKKRRAAETRIGQLEEMMDKILEWKMQCEEMDDGASGGGSTRSVWSLESGRSGCSYMSVEDVNKVKSVVNRMEEMERRERFNNIAIKGTHGIKDGKKEEVEQFLQTKLGIEVKVEEAWKRGQVVLAKLKDEDEKRKVMENKSKLKETQIFIDHDLSKAEQLTQRDIQEWVKKKKEAGFQAKVGFGRVWIDGRWSPWDIILEKEKLEKERERKRKWDETRSARIRAANEAREIEEEEEEEDNVDF